MACRHRHTNTHTHKQILYGLHLLLQTAQTTHTHWKPEVKQRITLTHRVRAPHMRWILQQSLHQHQHYRSLRLCIGSPWNASADCLSCSSKLLSGCKISLDSIVTLAHNEGETFLIMCFNTSFCFYSFKACASFSFSTSSTSVAPLRSINKLANPC